MRAFLVLIALFSIAYSARTNYTVTPAQWSAWRSATSAAGIADQTPANLKIFYPAAIFNVKFDFGVQNCASSAPNSAVRNQIQSSASSAGCTVKSWYQQDCAARVTFQCASITQMTSLVSSSPHFTNYGKTAFHWWRVGHQGSHSSRVTFRNKRDEPAQQENSQAERQTAPYLHPLATMDAEACLLENELQGWTMPTEPNPRWHIQASSQNNGPVPSPEPFTKQSAYAGNRIGRIYVADSGVDAQHPEFIDDVTLLSRVQDETFHIFLTPAASTWMSPYHDENGHGTVVASFAAGKTLGVFPKATIVNLKFFVSNTYDCVTDPEVTAAMVPTAPAGYPFREECGTQAYSYGAFVNAATWARTDAIAYRAMTTPIPSVFVCSAGPRWWSGTDTPMDDCITSDCMADVTDALQAMTTSGVVVVLAAGNEGWKMDTDANFQANGVYAPYLFTVPDIIIAGGTDRNYQQAIYNMIAIDPTEYWMENFTGASNWGPAVDYWAPAMGFPVWAQANLVRHRETVYIPPYWNTNAASGTSYAAPQIAAGILMYQTTLNNAQITALGTSLAPVYTAVKTWAAPHYQAQMWDDFAWPADPMDPNRPDSHMGLDWGDWVPESSTYWSFHLVPSANPNHCLVAP